MEANLATPKDLPFKTPDDAIVCFQMLTAYCDDRFIGVSDLAAVRFSLPSQLLEPTPNLEYWTYIDAPNAFVAMGTSDDPLDRMLEVVRFWLTKDLKYAKGKPCKPYNSCLGEFFRVRNPFLLPPIQTLRRLDSRNTDCSVV